MCQTIHGHFLAGYSFALTRLLLVFFAVRAGAAIVTVEDSDPRVVYNKPILPESICKGPPYNDECTGNWWYARALQLSLAEVDQR